MEWRFRKSFSPIPGVRITLSPGGISTSVGIGPLRVSAGSSGVGLTANVPGTGLSFRAPLAPLPIGHHPRISNGEGLPSQKEPFSAATPDVVMQAIKSAESSVLTSAGLEAFKQTLDQAEHQFGRIESDLSRARTAEFAATELHRRWTEKWLLRRIMKRRFGEIASHAEEATALRAELEQQLQLSRLPTQFEMPDDHAKAYEGFCDAFVALTGSQRIWDNVAHRATNKMAERTTASRVVDLKAVRFQLSKCSIIDSAMAVPRMENANGGDLFFYPGFLLYHAAARNYALVEYGDIKLRVRRSSFHEESTPPGDAKQIGTTWAKANKDGSPDKRFRDNYAIPIMQYATLTLHTASGLNEEYMVSNVEAAEGFLAAWETLQHRQS